MITLANLICGSLALRAIITSHDFVAAFWLILLAMVFDFFDGFAARLLGQCSPIGVQLDSLADMVSFGVAPAMVLSALVAESGVAWGEWGIYVPYVMIAVAALRLAKFNIDTQQRSEFIGLPTPAAALVCISLGLIHSCGVTIGSELVVAVSLVVGYLMISPIRMFALKFSNFSWADNRVRYMFLIVALLLIIVKPLYALPAIVAIYIVISITLHLTTKQNSNA